uniref:Uncharacterized protein n=1 Tax=Arundo donax TaxID=35708 RepID=A0A0A9EXF3_ARUDO
MILTFQSILVIEAKKFHTIIDYMLLVTTMETWEVVTVQRMSVMKGKEGGTTLMTVMWVL